MRTLAEDIKASLPFRDQDLVFQAVVKALYAARDNIIDDPSHALNRLIDQLGDEPCPFRDEEEE